MAFEGQSGGWTFLTNHTHVLICLDRDPTMRVRDVAREVGITERSVLRIILELEEAGALSRSKDGRNNHYRVRRGTRLRHPLEGHCKVGDLLKLVNRAASSAR